MKPVFFTKIKKIKIAKFKKMNHTNNKIYHTGIEDEISMETKQTSVFKN